MSLSTKSFSSTISTHLRTSLGKLHIGINTVSGGASISSLCHSQPSKRTTQTIKHKQPHKKSIHPTNTMRATKSIISILTLLAQEVPLVSASHEPVVQRHAGVLPRSVCKQLIDLGEEGMLMLCTSEKPTEFIVNHTSISNNLQLDSLLITKVLIASNKVTPPKNTCRAKHLMSTTMVVVPKTKRAKYRCPLLATKQFGMYSNHTYPR